MDNAKKYEKLSDLASMLEALREVLKDLKSIGDVDNYKTSMAKQIYMEKAAAEKQVAADRQRALAKEAQYEALMKRFEEDRAAFEATVKEKHEELKRMKDELMVRFAEVGDLESSKAVLEKEHAALGQTKTQLDEKMKMLESKERALAAILGR